MKRLVGGDYLLDLSSIELEESEDGSTKTNITDSDVLEQLTNLKKYINNPEMAKPVWVKLKNGENDELVIARGTFAVVDTGEFEICVQLDGYKLVIFIEFTQVLNSDDEPLDDWYIDTNDAKYLFTSDAQDVKATIEDEDFGDVALAGDLSIGGDVDSNGEITGAEIVEKMTGYSASLETSEHFTFENIYSGVVKNGNKLTFAIVLNITKTDTHLSTVPVLSFTIPSDVLAKLIPSSIGSYTALAFSNVDLIASDDTFVQAKVLALKVTNGVVIALYGGSLASLVANTKYYARLELTFLLSDNLISQP